MKNFLAVLFIFNFLTIFSQDIKHRFINNTMKYENIKTLSNLHIDNNFCFSVISNSSSINTYKFSFYDKNNIIDMNRNIMLYTSNDIFIPAIELNIQYNFYKKNEKFSMWTKTYSTMKSNGFNN